MGRSRLRLALASSLLLCACAGDRPARTTGDEPVQGGTVVVGGPNDLVALNPLASQLQFSQELNRFALFLPLIRYGPNLEYEPALARSWEMIGDTSVVFHLRDDVRWHDGVRTTAYDALFTYERAVDPETAFPNASYFEGWQGAEVVDSFTIRVRFQPMADALAGLPFTPIAPRHLLDTIPPASMANASFNRAPVGNGPFRFVEYRPNERWVFEANPDFPEELGGRPMVDRLVWRIIPDATAQVTELQTGGIDLALLVRAEDWASLDAQPEVKGVERESRQYAFIAWNGRRAPLDDARVRRALMLGIDRAEMIAALRAGHGTPLPGPVGPFHWAFADDMGALPYAPDSARALLAAAGLTDRDGDGILERPDGADFAFDLVYAAQSGYQRDVAEMVRADLADLGVRVTTTPLEFGTIVGRLTSAERAFDASVMGWESDFRLNLRDAFHSASANGPYQFAGYSNPAVDSIIDATMRMPDREAARPLLLRLQEIMRDEQPWGFLYYYPDLFAMRERLRGAEMDIRGTLVNLSEWWVSVPTSAPSDSADRAPSPGTAP